MKLARAALTHSQDRSDLAQTEFSGIAQTDYSPIAVWQTRDLLIENRRALIVSKQTMRRMLGRRRDPCFEIDHVIRVFAGPRETGRHRCGATPHGIQHLPPNAELRISGERYPAFGFEGALRLQQSDISRLNEVSHFETRTSGKTGKNPARDRTHETIHVFCRYCVACLHCRAGLHRNGLAVRLRRGILCRSSRAGCRGLRHQSKQWLAPGMFSRWLIGIVGSQH
jgi:hypothetical protein